MDELDWLESRSIFILREAYSRIRPLGMLWSLGKDSNVMVWLAKKAFLGEVPFPVVHLDTGLEFPETYAFRERYAHEWGLNLIADACPPIEETDPTLAPNSRLAARKKPSEITDIRGTAFISEGIPEGWREIDSTCA